MAASTTELNLNMKLPNVAVSSYAVQGDTLYRQIIANLYDGSTAWEPPEGAIGVVRFKKPDGTFGIYDTNEDGDRAVTWDGNVATILITQQCLAVAGDVTMQVNFYTSGGTKITTFAWEMLVQPAAVTDTELISTDYFNILTQEIADLLGALEDISTPSDTNPLMDGTASPGTANTFSRGDHRHPSDTTRVPTNRKVNNKALSNDITLSAADVGAVPTGRTVNGKELSSNITLNASDIPNDSTVPGEKVDDALDSLKGSLNDNVDLINSNIRNIRANMPYSDGSSTVATIVNGSASNPNNTQAVTNSNGVLIKAGQVATVKVFREPKQSGDYFVYGYKIIDGNGIQVEYKDYTTSSVSPSAKFYNVGSADFFIRFTIAETDGTNFTVLRATDFSSGDVVITIEDANTTIIDGQPRISIQSGEDLNNYTNGGSYYVYNDSIAAGISNMPRSASGTLLVIDRSNTGYYLMQIYIPTTSYQIIYTRFKNGTSWTGWTVRGEIVVHTGTVTTSGTGTASLAETFNTNQYMCLSIVTPAAVSGTILIPYKYGDAANGRWGFKAVNSAVLEAIASTEINYIALMYKYN